MTHFIDYKIYWTVNFDVKSALWNLPTDTADEKYNVGPIFIFIEHLPHLSWVDMLKSRLSGTASNPN
jgi:hypothetical protein